MMGKETRSVRKKRRIKKKEMAQKEKYIKLTKDNVEQRKEEYKYTLK